MRSADEARRLVASQPSSAVISLDCEGVRLGRFGKLSLVQMAVSNHFFLVDGSKDGVIEALEPLLSSTKILKIMHDCREDSAALFHQCGIRLGGVVDTQVAHLLLQRERKNLLHQESYTDLCTKFLKEQVKDTVDMKDRMLNDPYLWHKRPLSKELVDYALHGVEYLGPVWRSLKDELEIRGVSQQDVIDASQQWVEYCDLNREVARPDGAWKVGTPLLGMVAAINDKGVYFKLNLGITGVCSTPSARKRMLGRSGGFVPVQVGDTVELAVSGVSVDGKIVYVDRRDPDWEYFDFLRRPSPIKKDSVSQEYRHIPSLVEDQGIDPLIRRGLGQDGGIDSDDEDMVDHEPILTRKPPKFR